MGNAVIITYKTDFEAKTESWLLPVISQNYVNSVT